MKNIEMDKDDSSKINEKSTMIDSQYILEINKIHEVISELQRKTKRHEIAIKNLKKYLIPNSIKKSIKRFLRPNLGILHQYIPRPLPKPKKLSTKTPSNLPTISIVT